MNSDLRDADEELLKIVGVYQANPTYYNTVYELVDFSKCYIEIAKESEDGYVTLKKIESAEDWKTVLKFGGIDISSDNGGLFFEAGTYRILFKYNMTWITNPPGAVYAVEDNEYEEPIYPYGSINDQYEYFYITGSDKYSNILLPSNIEVSSWGFFSQIRALTSGDNLAFVKEDSVLHFENGVTFKIGAKADMTADGFYYNKLLIKDFSFTASLYDKNTDDYSQIYLATDLMPSISRETVYGDEITVDLEMDELLRDRKCKLTLSYSFINELTGEVITGQQHYYYTLEW